MRQLDVVAAYSNPIRWQNRSKVHAQFEDHMLDSGVRLSTIECAYGNRPFELLPRTGVNRIQVRSDTMVWNKENLLNIGIGRLPSDWRMVATLDGDILFRNPNWAQHTIDALDHYHVIQPWQACYDLGPGGEHLETHCSLLSLWFQGKDIVQGIGQPVTNGYEFGHPGFAWAWTRQALEWVGGLLEVACLGAADHHMALGLFGKAHYSYPNYISAAYKREIGLWQQRACKLINGRVGYLHNTIEHQWHGRKKSRAYIGRWDIIKKHAFDPDLDLKWNTHGVVELAGNKPDLMHDIDRYFRQRSEDANVVD